MTLMSLKKDWNKSFHTGSGMVRGVAVAPPRGSDDAIDWSGSVGRGRRNVNQSRENDSPLLGGDDCGGGHSWGWLGDE